MKFKNLFIRERVFFSTALGAHRSTDSHTSLLRSPFLHRKKGHDQPPSWCLVFSTARSAVSWIASPGVGVCEGLHPLLSPAMLLSPPASPAFQESSSPSFPHLAESPLGSAQEQLLTSFCVISAISFLQSMNRFTSPL